MEYLAGGITGERVWLFQHVESASADTMAQQENECDYLNMWSAVSTETMLNWLCALVHQQVYAAKVSFATLCVSMTTKSTKRQTETERVRQKDRDRDRQRKERQTETTE